MIGTAAKAHDVTAQPDDACHNADIDGFADQARPLLDVRFEIGAMTLGVEAGQRPVAQFKLRQPIHQSFAGLFVNLAQSSLADFAAESSAAETGKPGPLFVRERNHVDTDGATRSACSARDFKGVDDAQSAVEPAAIGHAVAVRADKNALCGIRRTSEHIADAVDHRFEAGGLHLRHQPAAGFEVRVAESRPIDAGSGLAEFGQRTQIRKHAILVDGQHSTASTTIAWHPPNTSQV